MENKKILALVLVSTIITSLFLVPFTSAKFRGGYEDKIAYLTKKLDLTETEINSLSSMSKEEKREFLKEKIEEYKSKKIAKQDVIDKLLAGEILTSEEEALRTEIIKERAKQEVISRLLAGDSLTSEQKVLRAEIIEERAEKKAKKEEIQAKKEEIRSIIEKKKNGEELTDEEESTLQEFKENRKNKKKRKRGGKRNR